MMARLARLRPTAKGSLPKSSAHQRHVRRLQRDGGAGAAHGNAHGGRRQRGRIVDAVARHRNRAVFALQRLNGVELVLRQQLRAHVGDADFLANLAAPRRRCRR